MPPPLPSSALELIANRVQDGWTFAQLDGEAVTLPELASRMNARGWNYDRRGPFGGREAVTKRVLNDEELAQVVARVRDRIEATHPQPSGPPSPDWPGSPEVMHPGWLRARYLDDQLSIHEIARIVGCSPVWMRQLLKHHGIPIRKQGIPPIFSRDDTEWLRARHVDDGWTLNQIAENRGCSYAAVRNALIRLNIPLRSSRAGKRHDRMTEEQRGG